MSDTVVEKVAFSPSLVGRLRQVLIGLYTLCSTRPAKLFSLAPVNHITRLIT